MPKYRKKPVIVEAEVYKPGMEDGLECRVVLEECRSVKRVGAVCNDCIELGYFHRVPYISTLENQRHYISPGDYIITGVKGERYPIKSEIFHMTYEEVE